MQVAQAIGCPVAQLFAQRPKDHHVEQKQLTACGTSPLKKRFWSSENPTKDTLELYFVLKMAPLFETFTLKNDFEPRKIPSGTH